MSLGRTVEGHCAWGQGHVLLALGLVAELQVPGSAWFNVSHLWLGLWD